ncbi:MFS transporter [Solitalea canadensis]|uniref:Arabinose efflux permease family protein n=1 Tax=Solitalea canadensis (strain ATCC 29591 / DSM 3403 / JCM 21819 / LMG 8368 / NBRC 15130 / NCIMB 12057 / USAM 9D) TaxID=929556 RepID=H8KPB8_SOLCM|nr:tetracycline resistance MFS efflux pump [Solitalea canadensis]AFD05816.1 arabinose efflux permease family protein [Solitalea canadensis DSM 3403]
MEIPPDKQKSPLLTIFITVFIDLLGIGIIIPIVGPLFIDSDILFIGQTSYEERTRLLGLLIATFSIFQFFSGPYLGGLSDKHGRKKVLFYSLFATLIGYLAFAAGIHFRKIEFLFIGRAIAGCAAGNLSVIYSAIADSSNAESKAKNFGMIGAAFGLGFIIGPVLGGILSSDKIVHWFDASTPIFFSALLVIINIILVIIRFPETLKTPNRKAKISVLGGFLNLRKVLNSGNLRALFIVVFLFFFGFTMFTQFFQVFLIKKFEFDEAHIGYIFGFIGLWGVITQAGILRLLSKKFSPYQLLNFALIVFAFSYLTYLLPQSVIGLYLCIPLFSIMQGLSMPNFAAVVSNSAPKHIQGETLGMQQSIQSLAQIITPLIGGFVVARSYYAPMWLGFIFTTIAWAIFAMRVKPKKEI